MKPLQIIKDTNGITIARIEDKRVVATFTSGQLIHMRENNVSDCIAHLDEKEGSVSKDFLYQLASFIHQHCPNHQINWSNTFWLVEANRSIKVKDDSGLSSVFDRVYKSIVEGPNADEMQRIEKTVIHNLSVHGLLQ